MPSMAPRVDQVLVVGASSDTHHAVVRVVRQGGGVFLGARDFYLKVLVKETSWTNYFYLAKGGPAHTALKLCC